MNLSACAVAPVVREGIARAQIGTRGEIEQLAARTVGTVQCLEGVRHRLHTALVCRDGKDAKGPPPGSSPVIR
jgi:hypothetical protein